MLSRIRSIALLGTGLLIGFAIGAIPLADVWLGEFTLKKEIDPLELLKLLAITTGAGIVGVLLSKVEKRSRAVERNALPLVDATLEKLSRCAESVSEVTTLTQQPPVIVPSQFGALVAAMNDLLSSVEILRRLLGRLEYEERSDEIARLTDEYFEFVTLHTSELHAHLDGVRKREADLKTELVILKVSLCEK